MLTSDQINELHRLYWSEHWPSRKIERHLSMGWRTIRKYLDAPAQGPAQPARPRQLDPVKATQAARMEKDPPDTLFCKSMFAGCVHSLPPNVRSCIWNHWPANDSRSIGPTLAS